MNSFEVYVDYLAVKNHFTTDSYHYELYNGMISATIESFEKRSDRLWFEKLSRHYDPHGLIIANIVENQNIYPRALNTEKAEKVYSAWKKRTQNLLITFKRDLPFLDSDFNKNLIVEDNSHPIALKKYFGNKISLETLTILCSLTGCGLKWDEELHNDYVWNSISLLTKKYPTFLNYNNAKVKEALFSYFSENAA